MFLFCFYFQPDLLNFKKGWMVKLDEQGQVFDSYPQDLRGTFPAHLSRLTQCLKKRKTDFETFQNYEHFTMM